MFFQLSLLRHSILRVTFIFFQLGMRRSVCMALTSATWLRFRGRDDSGSGSEAFATKCHWWYIDMYIDPNIYTIYTYIHIRMHIHIPTPIHIHLDIDIHIQTVPIKRTFFWTMVNLPQCRADLMIGNPGKTWGVLLVFQRHRCNACTVISWQSAFLWMHLHCQALAYTIKRSLLALKLLGIDFFIRFHFQQRSNM